MLYACKITMLAFFITISVAGCTTKIYSDERFAIDPNFLSLFNSLIQKDSIQFTNSNGVNKTFLITNIDSIISNEKGWFINEAPYKLLRVRFREIGKDTLHLERENEIFVNKNPATNTNSLCIKFNNFYYSKDSMLPRINYDTLSIANKKFTDYYLFETSLGLKNSGDVQVLYVSASKGFLGLKTMSGEVWVITR